MIIFIKENDIYESFQHIDQRVAERILNINIPDENKIFLTQRIEKVKNLLNNRKVKQQMPQVDKIGVYIGEVDAKRYPLVMFKGHKVRRIVDANNKVFFGSSLWVIIKNGRFIATTVIISKEVNPTNEDVVNTLNLDKIMTIQEISDLR